MKDIPRKHYLTKNKSQFQQTSTINNSTKVKIDLANNYLSGNRIVKRSNGSLETKTFSRKVPWITKILISEPAKRYIVKRDQLSLKMKGSKQKLLRIIIKKSENKTKKRIYSTILIKAQNKLS